MTATAPVNDRMITSGYSGNKGGEAAAAGAMWEQLQATGWDTSVPVVLTGTAMALLQGASGVVPIEPDADSGQLGLQISCGAYDIMTIAGLLVLHLLPRCDLHALFTALLSEKMRFGHTKSRSNGQ